MLVSIITVCYNSASTISDTIQSVISQTYAPIQYIIIDGGSTDGTQDIVKSFGPKISQFISERDKGMYDAMNKGIAMAKGDVVGILNSDDVYASTGIIAQLVTCFLQSDVEICYGDLNYVKAKNINAVTRIWKAGNHKPKSFYWGWMPPHPTVFVKKEVYQKVGNFNNSIGSAADYELMLRMFVKHKCKAAYLSQLLVKMRVGGLSNSSIKNRLKANRQDKLAWKINELKPYPFTLLLKPLRKLRQFIKL